MPVLERVCWPKDLKSILFTNNVHLPTLIKVINI